MKKVLIIKLSAFGDIVISTPHIDVLMNYHKHDEVTLVTSQAYADLFSAFNFSDIYKLSGKGVSDLATAAWFVFRQKFDVVYDLQSNDRTAILVMASMAKKRIGMAPSLIYTDAGQGARVAKHVYDRMNDLFGKLGLPAASGRPLIGVPEHNVKKVSDWLKRHDLSDGYVIFHAGSSPQWLSKRWPEAYFKRLAELFSAKGLKPVWIGAAGEAELNKSLSLGIGVDATGEFNFSELVELGRHARVAVVNDSGPMHLLSASGIPVYAIFGPTDFLRSHAVGQRKHVLRHPVDCSPCFLKVCPAEKKHACMESLIPEDVYKRISEDLDLE